jgi:hypothetical protein
MATPGRLQFSYDLNRRYHSELHAPRMNNFPKQHSNDQLKAKYNLNKKVASFQDSNFLFFFKEGRFLMIF